jgi:hypothetical protein
VARFRTALRVLLAALVLLEGAGIARALGHGADVSCCCGEHSSARKCDCHDCPVVKRRAPESPDAAQLDEGRGCDGRASGDALLVMVALTPPPLTLSILQAARAAAPPPLTLPPERLIEAGRPPP